MRPDFKTIDITKDAFGVQHAPIAEGEKWITPELIPVKNVYTKSDLEGLEHLNYVSGLPPFLLGPSVSMPDSLPPLNQTLSIVVTSLQVRKVSP